MRKWLVEETGEVGRPGPGGMILYLDGSFQRLGQGLLCEYPIVKVTEIPDLKVGDWVKLPTWGNVFYKVIYVNILDNILGLGVGRDNAIVYYGLNNKDWIKRGDNPVSFDEWNW